MFTSIFNKFLQLLPDSLLKYQGINLSIVRSIKRVLYVQKTGRVLHFYSANLTRCKIFCRHYHGRTVKNVNAPSPCCKIHDSIRYFGKQGQRRMEWLNRLGRRTGRGTRKRFHSFCDIYLFAAKNGQPIWHYFSRQTDFIDLPLSRNERVGRNERVKRGAERERKRG